MPTQNTLLAMPFASEQERVTLLAVMEAAGNARYLDYVMAEVVRCGGVLYDYEATFIAGQQYSQIYLSLNSHPIRNPIISRFRLEPFEREWIHAFRKGVHSAATINDILKIFLISAGIDPLGGKTDQVVEHGRSLIRYINQVRLARLQREISHAPN